MADYTKKHHHHQTQPLTQHNTKSDNHHHHQVILNMAPYHHPPPPKRASKCFVYSFAIFVLLCLLLFIFSLVFLRPKPLPLLLSSPSLKSLTYDVQSPAFSATFSPAAITIRNPNFAPLRLRSASISFLHGNSSVGSGSATIGSRSKVIGGRSEEVVKVAATAAAKSAATVNWEDQEKNMLRNELNSGVLMMKGFVRASGEVVLFRRISRKTYGELECDISIDLRSQQLVSFVCS